MVKGSLSPLKNENKLDEDFYCTLNKFVLIRFIQRNQGHRDSVMHEFHSNVNKVNKAVAKVRTIGDRLPLRQSVSNLVGSPAIGSNPIAGTTNQKPAASSAVQPSEVNN